MHPYWAELRISVQVFNFDFVTEIKLNRHKKWNSDSNHTWGQYHCLQQALLKERGISWELLENAGEWFPDWQQNLLNPCGGMAKNCLRPLKRKNYTVKIKIIIKIFLTDWAGVESEKCRNELISTPSVSVPADSVPGTGPCQNLEQPPSFFQLVFSFWWILTECNIWLQQSVFSF